MSIRPVRERPPLSIPTPTSTSTSTSTSTPASRPTATPTEELSPFGRILRGLGEETVRGEQAVSHALAASRAGADPGPGELLALQAGVYRYSEVVDLAAKLVDRASSGVKTVIGGQ